MVIKILVIFKNTDAKSFVGTHPCYLLENFKGETLILVSMKCRERMERPAEFSLFYVNHQLVLLLALPEPPSWPPPEQGPMEW